MAMKADITVPLSLVVAAAATFLTNAAMHYSIYGGDPQGFFAFRFFGEPAIVILLVLVPAATVLVLRLVRHRRAVTLRRRAAYFWLIGTLIVLGVFAVLAFTGVDSVGYWLFIFLYWTPIAVLISSALGVAALFVLTRTLARQRSSSAI